MKKVSLVKKLGDLSVPLILGVIFALVWANVNYESYTNFWHLKIFGSISLDFLINDIFMVFFFALAGIEIVHALSKGGSLYPVKNAISNLFATFGGIVVPVIVFFVLNFFIGSAKYVNGWAIPTATDIAISLLFAHIIFGKRHPAVSFLIMLAVLDDAIGLAIIAGFYSDPASPVRLSMMLFVGLAVVIALIFNRMKVQSYWPYIFLAGTVSWVGMLSANLHPALALVFIVPFLPKNKPESQKHSPLVKFEKDWKFFVNYGLFFFGLANAGVKLTAVSELAVIVFLSLFIGKTLGIFAFAKLALLFNFHLPKGIKTAELFTLSMIASVGLTVSLFISSIAYIDVTLQDGAKMGALFSIFGGLLSLIVGKIFIKKDSKQNTN